MSDPADLQRMIGDLVRLGLVHSVDLQGGTCRVEIGEIITGDIPFLSLRAGRTRTWSPPSVGEQVLVIAREADTEAGLVLPGIFSDAFPAPSAEPIDLIEFEDGARISYDAATHLLSAILPAGGRARIEAPNGLAIVGNVAIEGDLIITGTATAEDDVVGGGKSLKSHVHTKVAAGTAVSGEPQ